MMAGRSSPKKLCCPEHAFEEQDPVRVLQEKFRTERVSRASSRLWRLRSRKGLIVGQDHDNEGHCIRGRAE